MQKYYSLVNKYIIKNNKNKIFDHNYDNIIYIKGSETFIPGILLKTICGIEIFKDRTDFDYIIRTNISEIVKEILND